jgi:branched-chain amino acid transport system ATP-binding protein
MALLEVQNLSKHFGGLVAVSELSFDVHQGEILGLIGPNGAGKTTVYNCISGALRPTSGRVFFNGKEVTGLLPHKIAQKGIARTFQLTTLFTDFPTVLNVLIGFHMRSKAGFLRTLFNTSYYRQEEAGFVQKAMEILKSLGIEDIALQSAANLPHGHQRALGMAIALATEPKLLMLDEPVTGMNPEEVRLQLDRMRRIRKEMGLSIIVVEHNMRAVMGICDRIIAINFGKKIAEGTPAEIRENRAVIEAYLGAEEGYSA